MRSQAVAETPVSVTDAENWFALGAGAVLLLVGASRRTTAGTWLAVSSAPLLYKGLTGHWPAVRNGATHADADALAGRRSIDARESIRLEVPVAEVYRFWRRLENLPRFMTHLDSVTESGDGTSRWVARGPAGLTVTWNAEIVNEVENMLIAWRSLPGSEVMTAGSVSFAPVRGGRSTQVNVRLQYAPPAGKAGALLATLFGREPSQTIREDMRHFKQQLEAGEMPRATATEQE